MSGKTIRAINVIGPVDLNSHARPFVPGHNTFQKPKVKIPFALCSRESHKDIKMHLIKQKYDSQRSNRIQNDMVKIVRKS